MLTKEEILKNLRLDPTWEPSANATDDEKELFEEVKDNLFNEDDFELDDKPAKSKKEGKDKTDTDEDELEFGELSLDDEELDLDDDADDDDDDDDEEWE